MRWTIHVCKDCEQLAHYQDRCPKDRRRIWTEMKEVEVIPASYTDEDVERVAEALWEIMPGEGFAWPKVELATQERMRAWARAALEAFLKDR